ncbi:MAG: hypothetical protein ACHQ50_05015 [Fimbriimonadales bacterium]
MPIAKIADALGMSKPTVYKRLRAYEAITEYQHKTGDTDIRKDGYFDEATKLPDLQKWIQSPDAENMDQFMGWIHDGKFDRSGLRDLRDFAKILQVPRAKKVFERSGFTAAYTVLMQASPELASPVFKAVMDALEALRGISRLELSQLADDPRRVEMLKELIAEAQAVLTEASAN